MMGTGTVSEMETIKKPQKRPEGKKHGSQALATCTMVCGFRNCPVTSLVVAFQNAHRQQEHFRDHGSSWWWKRSPPFTSVALTPQICDWRLRDQENRANSEGQVYLPLFFFFLLAT